MNTAQKVFLISLCTVLLYGCQKARNIEPGNYSLAVDSKNGMQKTKYIPVPMPGQMMPLKKDQKSKRLVGEAAIEAANKKSVKSPNSSAYINSIMTFDYMPGALYQIYCAPLNITDIQFQNNEHIIATAAGDAIHWEVQKTYSGIGASRQEHLLIKPFEDDLTGSLVVTTDQRTYHLVLHATPKTYMASVTWRYPDTDGFLKQHDDPASDDSTVDITNDVDVNNMNFNYQVQTIKGPQTDWIPKMVFNDGKKTYIKFSTDTQELPALFIGDKKNNHVTNFRVQGNYYVVDSVVSQALLRGGPEKKQTTIQISMIKK